MVKDRLSLSLRIALLIALFGPSLNYSTLPASLPMIANFLGGGEAGQAVAQLTLGMTFLGLAVGGLLTGTLMSILGLRRLLLTSSFVYAASALVGASAGSGVVLLASSLVMGFAAASVNAGLTVATSLVLPDERRAPMLGAQAAAADIATIAGAVAGASLAQFYGWRAPFAVFIAYGAVVWGLTLISSIPAIPKREGRQLGLAVVAPLALTTYLSGFCLFLLTSTLSALLPFHLADHGLGTPALRAMVLTAMPIAATVGSVGYAINGGRLSDITLLKFVAVIAPAGFAGAALWTGGLPEMVMAVAAIGLATGTIFPMLLRNLLRRVPAALHGYGMGLLSTSIFTGGFVSPLVLGAMQRAQGSKFTFLFCALFCLGCCLLAIYNKLRDRAVAPPTELGLGR